MGKPPPIVPDHLDPMQVDPIIKGQRNVDPNLEQFVSPPIWNVQRGRSIFQGGGTDLPTMDDIQALVDWLKTATV